MYCHHQTRNPFTPTRRHVHNINTSNNQQDNTGCTLISFTSTTTAISQKKSPTTPRPQHPSATPRTINKQHRHGTCLHYRHHHHVNDHSNSTITHKYHAERRRQEHDHIANPGFSPGSGSPDPGAPEAASRGSPAQGLGADKTHKQQHNAPKWARFSRIRRRRLVCLLLDDMKCGSTELTKGGVTRVIASVGLVVTILHIWRGINRKRRCCA